MEVEGGLSWANELNISFSLGGGVDWGVGFGEGG